MCERSLIHLRELDLSQSNLDDDAARQLIEAPELVGNLALLDIRETQVSEGLAQELAALIPTVEHSSGNARFRFVAGRE